MLRKFTEKYNAMLRYMKGLKRYLIFSLLATIVSVTFNFLAPQVVSFTVDSVIGDNKSNALFIKALDILGGRESLRNNLYLCALGVAFCAGISAIFNYLSRTNIAKCSEGYIKTLRDSLFDHVQRLPFKWHVANQTGDIIQRCTYDVDMIRNFISTHLLQAMRTVLLLLIAFIIMFSMNMTLSLAALVFIPIIVSYSLVFYHRVSKQFLQADEAEGAVMVNVQENLTGVRVVKAFGRQSFELNKFDKIIDVYVSRMIKLGKTLATYWGIGDIASGLQIMTVIIVGSYMAAKGQISLGQFLVFVSYTRTISYPVRALGRTLSEMSKASVSAERLTQILDTEPEKDEEFAPTPDLHEDIVFKNVSFSYTGKSVVENLNFTIEKGTTFGILGSTGSGKSTVTYLLSRLYDLEENQGSITIGGVDIRKIKLSYLRRNVGLVLQEPFLFSKSIKDNIDITTGSNDLSRIRRRAKAADVDDNIMEFTQGYETVVGERGVTLSGGQKQRIAIARTLMLQSPIMIFDDSLSAVDMETDARILGALRNNTGGATVILISHRVSTLMNADKILVLDGGAQAELGTHSQLLKKGGIYSKVYKLQGGDEGGI